MRLEAHFRAHALLMGEWHDELHFAMLEREWRRGAMVRELDRHRVA
jgi:RimJ/RimL family protein N-acetyltransferase